MYFVTLGKHTYWKHALWKGEMLIDLFLFCFSLFLGITHISSAFTGCNVAVPYVRGGQPASF